MTIWKIIKQLEFLTTSGINGTMRATPHETMNLAKFANISLAEFYISSSRIFPSGTFETTLTDGNKLVGKSTLPLLLA